MWRRALSLGLMAIPVACSSGSGGSGGSGAAPLLQSVAEARGCAGAKLLQVPDDPSMPGPWPVGVKTMTLEFSGGSTKVEVWYPATRGSDAGQTKVTYDVTKWLPAGQAAKIPASANRVGTCDCYRDLPLDTTHGPYPAVLFIHGTGSFRVASTTQMTQWASRGFIAVAADHPGLDLADTLATFSLGACTGSGIAQNISRDIDAEITALTHGTGDLAFFAGSVDMTRIGIGGHSQGASNAAMFSTKPNVEIDFPLADLGGTVVPSSPSLKSVLVVGGMSDSVVPYSSDQSAYSGSPAPKRLVGITGGDHLDVTDLCWQTNSSGQTAIQVALQYGVCGAQLLAALAKCGKLDPPQLGPDITNYVTTAALEETLHCVDRSAAFSNLKTKYPEVGDFQQSP